MSAEVEALRRRHRTRWVRRGLWVIAVLLLAGPGAKVMFWQVERFAMEAYRIPSSAMEPTLRCARPAAGCEGDTSDRVFVSRVHAFWTPSRGDIVAFRTPRSAVERCGSGGTYVKRIVGLPEERVEIRGAAFVYVDGRRLEETYIGRDRRDVGPPESFTVPEDSYLVLGDNRSQSCDSRVFGSVPRANIVGPVAVVYWPIARIGSP